MLGRQPVAVVVVDVAAAAACPEKVGGAAALASVSCRPALQSPWLHRRSLRRRQERGDPEVLDNPASKAALAVKAKVMVVTEASAVTVPAAAVVAAAREASRSRLHTRGQSRRLPTIPR
jgi:hypothetical protein